MSEDDGRTLPRVPTEAEEAATLARLDQPTKPSEEDRPVDPEGPPLGAVLADKYEIVRVIGAGGMGRVYKGQHLSLGVPVAIKTMHHRYAGLPEYVRRFRREAHAISLLSHPNVVRVLDFGEDAGTLFLVMEFLEGRSLGRMLESLTMPPPLVEVTEIMSPLCDAFEVAHAFGIIHRDLKPDNVFLSTIGAKRIVKVLDFGLAHVDDARDVGPTLTNKDVVAGTPEYMSPEQCRSLLVGTSADLYSLGCILTTLLQLRPPFREASAIDTMAKHMFSPPPPLSRPAGAELVPPLLEKLRLDLLAKKPERRPKSAAEIKARLLEAMSREAEEKRLPPRKGETEGGDRSERAPEWGTDSTPPTPTERNPLGARDVGLWRTANEGERVSAECETGLAMQNIEVVVVSSAAEIVARGLSVVIVDAGSNLMGASARLGELAKEAPGTRAVVCAAGLSADRISDLVAAGAADVVRYPVSADVLGRKLERVLRRGR